MPTCPSSHELLPFQRILVDQVLEENGICILAPGLGLHQVVAVLLRLQDVRRRDTAQKGVLLVIGASPWQRMALKDELVRIHPPDQRASHGADVSTDVPLPADVTADIAMTERLRLYNSCSCVFVTTRILVVDLLSGRLSPANIGSMVILNAHRVSDASGEAFAVRLYHAGNAEALVRAFSDNPSAFAAEFGKAEKVMKALGVRKLHLWPRFQVLVQENLESTPPELIEISVPQDSGAALIYEALTELVDSCIKELRRYERLDTTELTASRGLFASFDEAIRRQLAPVWHVVSPKTRQLVSDLRTLRTLATYLHRFDPVTFLMYLDTLRVTEGAKCAWIFHSAAHTVFEAAKSRVFKLVVPTNQAQQQQQQQQQLTRKRKSKSDAPNKAENGADPESVSAVGAPSVDPVLEELPKWHALREILEEAMNERSNAVQSAKGNDNQVANHAPSAHKPATPSSSAPPVVVFCQDEFTCRQLQAITGIEGPSGHMRRMYKEYLQYRLDSGSTGGRNREKNGVTGSDASANQFGKNTAVGNHAPRMMGGAAPGEDVALTKEARQLGAKKTTTNATKTPGNVSRGTSGTGRRVRGRGPAVTAAHAIAARYTKAAAASTSSALDATTTHGGNNQSQQTMTAGEDASSIHEQSLVAGPGSMREESKHGATKIKQELEQPDIEGVQFVPLDTQGALPLWRFLPTHVVVYDPDVALTRALEVYRAQHASRPLRVYLLRYEDSPETDKYQASVLRERSAFENLIRAKGIMAPLTSIGGPAAGNAPALPAAAAARRDPQHLPPPGSAGNALTRRAGGRLPQRAEKIRVIVDVREFMSSLPSVLHAQGLQLVPVTLEVGDYVLSPEICVERKTLSDLRGSLASGRLYQQAEAMCQHYKTAILLIEFDNDRAFALQGAGELGDDIQAHSLMSRLVLLCLHHPRLRLVWSRSLHATSDMFAQLKANHEEPDAVTAATIGLAPDEANNGESVVNAAAFDVLRRLPGVTEANWRQLSREAGSLAGLCEIPASRLAEIMGGEAVANRLKEFLTQECRALFRL